MDNSDLNKVRILMVLGSLKYGGAEIFCSTILEKIDRSKYSIDFVVTELTHSKIEEKVINLGSKIYVIPRYKIYNVKSYKCAFDRIFKNNHYDIVHGHASGAMSIYLSVAKKNGCVTIAHSHSGSFTGNIFVRNAKRLTARSINRYADYKVACSKKAAINLFGKRIGKSQEYIFIPNGIDTSKFKFDLETREKIRKLLKVDNKDTVYIHVGRFSQPKNHVFLLDIFEKIAKCDNNSYLLLCGDGPLSDKIHKIVSRKKLSNNVIFAGEVPNINEYLFGADLFLLPSLFEGLPITLVEAQASGLGILCSETVTSEVKITDGLRFLNNKKGADFWAKESLVEAKKERNRLQDNKNVANSPFVIDNLLDSIMRLYKRAMNQKH